MEVVANMSESEKPQTESPVGDGDGTGKDDSRPETSKPSSRPAYLDEPPAPYQPYTHGRNGPSETRKQK